MNEIKAVFAARYGALLRMFDYYCCVGGQVGRGAFAISENAFLDLCKKCAIPDPHCTVEDIGKALATETATLQGPIHDIHNVRVRQTSNGLVVNYHCRVDPALERIHARVHLAKRATEHRVRVVREPGDAAGSREERVVERGRGIVTAAGGGARDEKAAARRRASPGSRPDIPTARAGPDLATRRPRGRDTRPGREREYRRDVHRTLLFAVEPTSRLYLAHLARVGAKRA